MKKLLLMIGLLLILSGCKAKATINVDDSTIYLRVGDTYQIEATHPLGETLSYIENSPYFSISNSGLIEATLAGTTKVIIKAPNTYSKEIVVEIVENPTELRVHFIDVGQADSILICLPNDEVLMIDCGLDYESTMGDEKFPSWNNILTALNLENISTIDHMIITHNHSDHYYFVPDILSKYDVLNIYSSGSVRYNSQYLYIMRSIENAGLSVQVVETKDLIIDEGPLKLQVVGTQVVADDEDTNYSSVMVRLSYYNRHFMFTGDAGSDPDDGEAIAIASGIELKSDVLKVGHHGSAYSSGAYFLELVSPEYAVITTSDVTSTGHPHYSALQRLSIEQATILQTKDYGTITFTTDGFDLTYASTKQPQEEL